MPNRMTNEAFSALIEHLRVQLKSHTTPNFLKAQRATGIDRRTVAAHWERAIHGLPSIRKILRGDADGPTSTPPSVMPPAAPTPSAPATSDTPPTETAALVPLDPIELLRAQAAAVLGKETEVLGASRNAVSGLLGVSTKLIRLVEDSEAELREVLRFQINDRPREAIKLLTEVAAVVESCTKSAARVIESQRVIAGLPTSVQHHHVTHGPAPQDDAERDEAVMKEFEHLTSAHVRRLQPVTEYAGEEHGHVPIDVESVPVRPQNGQIDGSSGQLVATE
jgi:hypothetical protein